MNHLSSAFLQPFGTNLFSFRSAQLVAEVNKEFLALAPMCVEALGLIVAHDPGGKVGTLEDTPEGHIRKIGFKLPGAIEESSTPIR